MTNAQFSAELKDKLSELFKAQHTEREEPMLPVLNDKELKEAMWESNVLPTL